MSPSASSVCVVADVSGVLTLGDILAAAGLEPADVLAIRHTPTQWKAHPTDQEVMAYTRRQDVRRSKVPAAPPRIWLVFMSDGERRSRLHSVFENAGESDSERTDSLRSFSLHESLALQALKGRLVVEWPNPINWAAIGTRAADFSVIEISDALAFPGFDAVLLTHSELVKVVASPAYDRWRTALSSVQGIYAIADTSSGKLYVGQAPGKGGFLARWKTYAANGHGGNKELIALQTADGQHAQRYFQYSILRVFGLGVGPDLLKDAEQHYKRALLTLKPNGLNANL